MSFSPKIKIFADGADLTSMLEMAKNPHVQGLTTNPSLMKKAGVKDYRAFCKEVLTHIKDKPISFEVFADDFTEMKRQAMEIAAFGKNVYVKIPITNCEGRSAAPLIQELAHKKVSLNVTALLTLGQVVTTCEALKGGAPSIVSVFAGRVADTGRNPAPLMAASLAVCQGYDKKIELLWASSREVYNVIEADQIGCHIITVTPEIIKKLPMLGKDLDQLSLETVRTFKQDADAAGFSL
jgi:transaldolase